jgi:hypothetical protein
MLMIKDLADSKTLDRDAMASVAGGSGYGFVWPGSPFKEVYKLDQRSIDVKVDVLQGNTQTLVNNINNANQFVFGQSPTVHSDPTQTATNNSNINIG